MVSLHNRHLIDRRKPEYDLTYINKYVRHILHELDEHMNTVEPVGLYDIAKSYAGAKRRSYILAADDIIANGFNEKRASRVKMFIKPDKYDAVKINDKAPRAIQFRTAQFNLMIARYLKPIEHKLYSHVSKQSKLRWCAKGLNNFERAKLIQTASAQFDDPLYIMMDHSKFDSSVTSDHLKLMARRYAKWSQSKLLLYLLTHQWANKGLTQSGIRYSIKGTKMSGDFNTALDNSFLNYLCLRSLFDRIKVKAEYVVDGDDSVVIIEKTDQRKFLADLDHFKRFGFDTEIAFAHDLSEVEFCRSKILDLEEPLMAREPVRALSNLSVGLKCYKGKARLKYLAGNALGEMHRSSACPLLYPVAEAIYNKFGRNGVIMDTEGRYKYELYKLTDNQLRPPGLEEREAYQQAYGLGVQDQIQIEKELLDAFMVPGRNNVSDTRDWIFLPESAADVKLFNC